MDLQVTHPHFGNSCLSLASKGRHGPLSLESSQDFPLDPGNGPRPSKTLTGRQRSGYDPAVPAPLQQQLVAGGDVLDVALPGALAELDDVDLFDEAANRQ